MGPSTGNVANGEPAIGESDPVAASTLDRVGYSDDSAFRRLFKKYTGVSPRDYRRRFGIEA